MDLTKIKEPLSKEELQVLSSLLQSLESGDTSPLRDLYELDYEYTPVDIEEFLSDDYFLGKSTDGGNEIYSYWHDVLQEIFELDEKHEIILTGPIGTGKSTISVIGLAYILHKLMCLKEPQKAFGLLSGSAIILLFFSLSVNLMDVGAFHTLTSMLINSPFFLERGEVLGTKNFLYKPPKNIILNTGSAFSAGFGAVGLNVFGGILDEFNEVPASVDAMKEKAKILRVYQTVSRRMTSRFMQMGFLLGKLFLVSSTKDDDAMLTAYIEEARDRSSVLIYNDPVWVVKPHKFYLDKMFTVAVGDQYRESLIIPEEESEKYEKEGYRVLRVPMDLHNHFKEDINEALQDFAGVGSKTGRISRLFPNVIGLKRSISQEVQHPFSMQVISVGLYGDAHIEDFFDASKLKDIDMPHYLHTDIGITGDALGLCMAHPDDVIEDLSGEMQVHITVDFLLKVTPQSGSEIPIREVRQFIMWLRRYGVTIASVTADGYQSRDMLQVLLGQGIDASTLSVDKNDIPYLTLKSALFDGMVSLYHYPPLWRELKDLLHDKQKKKVDHPKHGSDGKRGSKDVADALAGVIYKIRHDFSEGALDLSLMKPSAPLPSNVIFVPHMGAKHGPRFSDLDRRLLGL